MKQFDIELAKAGHPVQTRDGRPVRVICYDVKGEEHSRLLALVSNEKVDYEFHIYCDSRGICSESNPNLDLVMAPIKKEGWVNVYKKPDNPEFYKTDCIWSSEEIAKNNINPIIGIYITSRKIEWEE